MRILVTGHRGYIGTILTPMLVSAGHHVVGLDSDLYQRCTFSDRIPNIESINKDLRDIDTGDVDGFDAIIHLAALSNDPLGDLNPNLTYEINYIASVKLAKLAKKANVPRFLFSSSCSTYGAAGDGMLNEDAEFNPVTPYGNSKVLVEKEVSKLADENFSPTFLRNTTAYGVSPRMRFDIVLNNLVAWAYSTGSILIKSDGTPWRPLIHIEDISRGFLSVLNASRDVIHNQAFNVGLNEENYQIRDLAEIVRETVPGCKIEYAKDAGPDKRSYRVDFSKIFRTLPDFKPQWNVKKGVRELYEAYKSTMIKVEDFEGPRYKRIDHIKQLLSDGHLDINLRWVKAKINDE